ncbi:hypothetical protein F5884DRAFT_686034, partial [Xylogone sp. PMI_703]
QNLLDIYIIQNNLREVNLFFKIRDELVFLVNTFILLYLSHLDQAVKVVYDLMDELVFVLFLNLVMLSHEVSDSYFNSWTLDNLVVNIDK